MRSNLWKILIVVGLLPLTVFAAREAKVRSDDNGEAEAQRLLDKSQEFLQAKETERGVKMLETVLEQYPKSHVRYAAFLALGRYYVGAHDLGKAIGYLANLKAFDQPDAELTAADRAIYLEGLYLMGVAYFQMHSTAPLSPSCGK